MNHVRPWLVPALFVGLTGLTTAPSAQSGRDVATQDIKPAPGEPPEHVLVAIKTAEYEQINKAGGMPLTVTASGRSTVLKPKVWSARKNGPCRAMPGYVNTFECSLDMMVTLREGDTRPGKHAERVHVHWDGAAWKAGTPGRRK